MKFREYSHQEQKLTYLWTTQLESRDLELWRQPPTLPDVLATCFSVLSWLVFEGRVNTVQNGVITSQKTRLLTQYAPSVEQAKQWQFSKSNTVLRKVRLPSYLWVDLA